MLTVGALFGVAAVFIGQFYALNDYWNPPYIFSAHLPLEDFLYGFFISGITAVFHKKIFKPSRYFKTSRKLFMFGILPLLTTIFCFFFTVNILGLNSIIAHIIPPAVVGIVIVSLYPHLLTPIFTSSIFAVLLTFLLFQSLLFLYPNVIANFWMLENLSGILWFEIPVEEYVFAAVLGFSVPFFYEVITGCIPIYKKTDANH